MKVIAVAGDVGQGKELDGLEEKAKRTGASKCYIADLTKEYVQDCATPPTVKASAVYEGKYLLGTSTARPIIAKRLGGDRPERGGAGHLSRATGKGNDQVRFELTIKALAPDLDIIAPWRIWDIKSRDEEIDYAKARNIEIPVTKEKPYSMERSAKNWHLSHEGGDPEDPWNEPKDDLLLICNTLEKAPDKAAYIEIGFEKGIPRPLSRRQKDRGG